MVPVLVSVYPNIWAILTKGVALNAYKTLIVRLIGVVRETNASILAQELVVKTQNVMSPITDQLAPAASVILEIRTRSVE